MGGGCYYLDLVGASIRLRNGTWGNDIWIMCSKQKSNIYRVGFMIMMGDGG